MKKIVIMSHIDKQQQYTPASHEFSNFFLPFPYMQHLALRKRWEIIGQIDKELNCKVTKAGCDFLTEKGVVKKVSSIARDDLDLVEIVEREFTPTQYQKVIWKVVQIPDDVEYEILGTSNLNETVVYVDVRESEPFVTVQKPDDEKDEFEFPKEVLEEYVVELKDTKLLYNPTLKKPLQSVNQSGKFYSTRQFKRYSTTFIGIVAKYMKKYKYLNILNVNSSTKAEVKLIHSGFEIAVPKDF